MKQAIASDRLLWGLLYESVATRPFDDDELHRMLEQARLRNEQLLITGWLTYSAENSDVPGNFTQYIEGPRHAVRRLFYGEGSSQLEAGPGIIDDLRHTAVRVIQEGSFGGGPPGCRLYPKWAMSFQSAPPKKVALTGEQ